MTAQTADQQWMDELAVATIGTAFGKRMTVRVVERDGNEASIVLPSGRRACVQWRSLDFSAQPEPEPVNANPVTEPGMYLDGETIYKVQAARESGNLYAKRLVRIGGNRLAENGEIVKHEFEYAPGAVRMLDASKRMTLEQAKALGIEYGFCVVCGAFLKDAASVAAGIGPVCAGRV